MNKNTYLNEEHIVAYLDGEVALAGKEVRAALAADPELAKAALDYHGLQKAFAASAGDKRFALTEEIDRKTLKALRETLRTSRGEVRIPERSADAMPVRSVRTALVKQLWFKRSSIGLAFAVLLGALFFSLTRNDIKVEPSVADKGTSVTAPLASQEKPSLPQSAVSSEVQSPAKAVPSSVKTEEAPEMKAPAATPVSANKAETTTPSAQNVAQAAPAPASDPEDIMISHRFAKMIKQTRVVEVTQQDKM
jgi:hypothetical protein